jgi:soluble lytic murein transglycosylase-like protein
MNILQILTTAAKSAKVSGAILIAICSHESGLKNIVSQYDGGSPSYGVCQMKYETASMLGYLGTPQGLMNPRTNAKYAALYLKRQYERYNDWCRAIAAYNAGRYNESKILPGHPRNLKYVKNVRRMLNWRLQKETSCDITPLEGTNVAENYGPRR